MLSVASTESELGRRCISFLVLGERLGSFKWRDMRGRSLPGGQRLNYAAWRSYTRALAAAGHFKVDRLSGARPVGDLRSIMARVAAGQL
jgi:hypothetical protein